MLLANAQPFVFRAAQDSAGPKRCPTDPIASTFVRLTLEHSKDIAGVVGPGPGCGCFLRKMGSMLFGSFFFFLSFFDLVVQRHLRDHRLWKQNDRDKSWRLACVGCFVQFGFPWTTGKQP